MGDKVSNHCNVVNEITRNTQGLVLLDKGGIKTVGGDALTQSCGVLSPFPPTPVL